MPRACPALHLFGLLSKRWMLLILHTIFGGTTTFNAMKRQLGSISSRTLSARLKELEDEGFIARTILSNRPIRIEYRPTEKSTALHEHLEGIGNWARAYEV